MRRITLCATAAVALLSPLAIAPAVGASGPAPTRTANPAQYVVQPGDYLLGIAKKLNVGFRDLLDLNKLTPTSALFPGDVLKVPPTKAAPPATKSPVPATTVPATKVPAAVAQPVTYTIQAGDSIFGIAKKYGLKYGSILKLNGITLESMLQPGTVLLLPAGSALVKPTAVPPPVTTVPATTVPATTVPATTVPATTVPAATPVDQVVAFAKAQVGKPYQYFTAGPDAYDCSGLTLAAYKQIGVKLVHQSLAQSQQGRAVDWTVEPIKPGDLVFMYSTRNPSVISHVGIAISATRWIHSPRPGDVVREGPIPPSDRIVAVRRFVES